MGVPNYSSSLTVVRLVLYPCVFRYPYIVPSVNFIRSTPKKPKFWNRGIFKIYRAGCFIDNLRLQDIANYVALCPPVF